MQLQCFFKLIFPFTFHLCDCQTESTDGALLCVQSNFCLLKHCESVWNDAYGVSTGKLTCTKIVRARSSKRHAWNTSKRWNGSWFRCIFAGIHLLGSTGRNYLRKRSGKNNLFRCKIMQDAVYPSMCHTYEMWKIVWRKRKGVFGTHKNKKPHTRPSYFISFTLFIERFAQHKLWDVTITSPNM